MGTYLNRFDLREKMADGEVDVADVLSLVDKYLNGYYPLSGYSSERLSLDAFKGNDWQVNGNPILIGVNNEMESKFTVNFKKSDGSVLNAKFSSVGKEFVNSSDFRDDTEFDVFILLDSGDRLDIDVKTMFEGISGLGLPGNEGYEYRSLSSIENYNIDFKNTNGTLSTFDDVIIIGGDNSASTRTANSDKGSDKGKYLYKNELGTINFTYGGTWNDSDISSGGKGGGTYSIDLEGYKLKFSYSYEGGTSSEFFIFKNLAFEVPEFAIELASYKFEVPEAPIGYEHYLDPVFEADEVGPVDPVVIRSAFEEYMLPIILEGNNVITGGSGDDFIDGGSGTDIAVYRGKFADYNFTKNENNLWVIRDTQSGRDGTDTIQNIETLRFSDKKTVSVNTLEPTPIPGVVSIQTVFDNDAGAFGLYLASNKALVIADSGLNVNSSAEGAITLLAANGKNFAFKPADNNSLLVDLSNPNPAKTYSIVYGKEKSWSQQFFDDEGIAVARAGKLSYSDVLSLESAFDKDITGEGDIGDEIVEVLISSEVGGVYKLESGAFAIGEIGLTEGDVPSSSVLLKSSTTKNWTPGSAEILGLIEDGAFYKMIVKNGARYSELTFNESGRQEGRAMTLKNADLVEKELQAGTDLTGDGYVGFIQDAKSVANETVATFEGDGSVYSVYSTAMTWAKANAYAKSLGGQLAVIEDENENDFLYGQIMDLMSSSDLAKSTAKDGGGAAYVWLGATDAVTEGVWKWVNNEDLDTDNFMWGINGSLSEPDDFGEKQDHLALGLQDWPVGDAGQWNDINGSNKLFFVVEFEGAYSYGA